MYLQITTKCNMKCAHCCYSCNKNGKHATWETLVDSIAFARSIDNETISIGGGEPTLHPRFFDILKICLEDFNYVWMATNGSQTDKMYRLSNIIDQNDYPDCNCSEDDIDSGYCTCYENGIFQEDKLSVALSLDYFHDPIDERIENLWRRRAKRDGWNSPRYFEIRDVTQSSSGVIAEGRAKRTGSGWNENDCVCPDLLIRPDGKIKLCGCKKSPIIGNVWYGIDEKWEKVIYEDDSFNDTRCYKSIK